IGKRPQRNVFGPPSTFRTFRILAQVFEITSKHLQFVDKGKGAGSFGFSRLFPGFWPVEKPASRTWTDAAWRTRAPWRYASRSIDSVKGRRAQCAARSRTNQHGRKENP